MQPCLNTNTFVVFISQGFKLTIKKIKKRWNELDVWIGEVKAYLIFVNFGTPPHTIHACKKYSNKCINSQLNS